MDTIEKENNDYIEKKIDKPLHHVKRDDTVYHFMEWEQARLFIEHSPINSDITYYKTN